MAANTSSPPCFYGGHFFTAMPILHKITLSTMGLLCLVLGGCSIQEDITRLDLRLATVESEQADMARRLDGIEARIAQSEKAGDQLRAQHAETSAVIAALRSDVNRLGGRIEETEYAMGRRFKEADASVERDRIEARLKNIETFLDLEPAYAPPARSGAGEKAVEGPGGSGAETPEALPEDPETLYQAAKRDLDRGAFETARTGFQKLLERYPKDKQADNAQFWIGETYYREQWYEKAILEYQKVIENYPDGNKVPASLLKQGLAFFNLGDKNNARLILKELIRKYPKSNEAQIARQKVKGMD